MKKKNKEKVIILMYLIILIFASYLHYTKRDTKKDIIKILKIKEIGEIKNGKN